MPGVVLRTNRTSPAFSEVSKLTTGYRASDPQFHVDPPSAWIREGAPDCVDTIHRDQKPFFERTFGMPGAAPASFKVRRGAIPVPDCVKYDVLHLRYCSVSGLPDR